MKLQKNFQLKKYFKVMYHQFDQDSGIYNNRDIKIHYRLTNSYKKIIDFNELRNLD